MRSSNIDWEAARARLAAAQAALAAADEPGEDALRALLHARAVALAVPKAAGAPVDTIELVVFRIGGQRYAIDAGDVLESIAIAETTALPGVPDFYRGLISHRGLIYPLVDIRPLIGETIVGAPPPQAMLFASEAAVVAVLADAVDAFVRIDAASIVPVAPDDEAEPVAALRGITTDAIVVLDIKLLLADARLIVDDRPIGG